MSKKDTETKIDAAREEDRLHPADVPPSIVQPMIVQPMIVQPMIDELVVQSPPELPSDDAMPPPRGPLHPPQPAEHHRPVDDPDDPADI